MTLYEQVVSTLGGLINNQNVNLNELTIEVSADNYFEVMKQLKDKLQFEILIDLCGVDYSTYKDIGLEKPRFAVVIHLLSVSLNQRIRVKVFCPDEDFPKLSSVMNLWSGANWFEREAFDLFGIIFEGHNDLRRILTDYGFIGHPFRKDFPLSGHVEMKYDEEKKRVIYQPLTIEPREITPRTIREENYGRN